MQLMALAKQTLSAMKGYKLRELYGEEGKLLEKLCDLLSNDILLKLSRKKERSFVSNVERKSRENSRRKTQRIIQMRAFNGR